MRSSQPQLSDLQEIILSIAPIPSALTSILGSSAIIYLAFQRRKIKRWTPYNRLLVAMSAYDIVFSFVIAIATFLRPQETSDRIWAFGNDASCQFIAFMIQASAAGVLYQAMLSIYFMLTTRYGMTNEKIAKRIEPFMHFFAVGYALGTAIVGAAMDAYGERNGPSSCRVIRYYDDSDVSDAEKSSRKLVIHFFLTIPVVAIFLCLICTQMSIYLFVRRHTDISLSQEETEMSVSDDNCFEDSSRPKKPRTNGEQQNREQTAKLTSQSQRLKLVCSQAFLYVSSFVLCQAFNIIKAALQNIAKSEEEGMEIAVKYFPVTVIHATLIPIQGLFNFLVYIRPRYLMLRLQFPREGRLWTVKRIFWGESFRPTHVNVRVVAPNDKPNPDPTIEDAGKPTGRSTMASTARLPREMISSVTASEGDFDSQIDLLGDDDRWQDASNQGQPSTLAGLATGINRLTDLEAISEMSETVFELTPYQINGSYYSNSLALHVPTEPSEDRWRGGSAAVDDTTSKPSSERIPSGNCSNNISDVPIQVPRRTLDTGRQDDTSVLDSTGSTVRTSTKHASSDVPLSSLPQRFCSLPPSEIEED